MTTAHPTVAPLEQVLRGTPLGPRAPPLCTDCHAPLHEGQPATVYAYRHSDETAWSVARCWCVACAPTAVRHPTAGAAEVLAEGTIAIRADASRQASQPVLADPAVAARSDPADGAPP